MSYLSFLLSISFFRLRRPGRTEHDVRALSPPGFVNHEHSLHVRGRVCIDLFFPVSLPAPAVSPSPPTPERTLGRSSFSLWYN